MASGIIGSRRREGEGFRIENPFTLKVGQVFTGFGIGCGVGIGVGRPLNLGAIPMLNQVMSATRGATDAFSGVTRHVNSSLMKLGAKNIEAGVGCGVGFGHGFGVGVALKPAVLNEIQSCLAVAVTKMTTKLGITHSLPFEQGTGTFPASSQNGSSTNQTSPGSILQLAAKPANQDTQGHAGSQPMQIGSTFENTAFKGNAVDSKFSSRTEKVISNFLQSPLLNGDEGGLDQAAGRLRSENNILQMVLKHQQIIEELVEENEKLRQILMEDLKIPPSKLEASSSGRIRNKLPCRDCFECRRKQRKSAD